MTSESTEGPLCKFGLISDIQYADIEDGWSFDGSQARYFRDTLNKVTRATEHWQNSGVEFIVQLGDIIDGKNRKTEQQEEALGAVLEILNAANIERLDLLGNHEFYNFSMDYCINHLNIGEDGYFIKQVPGWRLIFLNGFDISLIGRAEESAKCQEARNLLTEHNPQALGGPNWFDNLPEDKHRWVPYNGKIGPEQMEWLEMNIQEAQQENEKVICLCHIPAHVKSTIIKTILWNSEEVLELLHKYDNVIAYFAGHDHDGGFFTDTYGLHHWTFVSPLIAPVGDNTFVDITLYADRVDVQSYSSLEADRPRTLPCVRTTSML